MRIEEEIFYPAFLVATRDKDLHHEAEVEHAGAKKLIAEIEALRPEDEYYAPKVKVLSEMIKHHVKEEEKPGGMFAEARKSDMDLDDLGKRLRSRKSELEANGGLRSAAGRGRHAFHAGRLGARFAGRACERLARCRCGALSFHVATRTGCRSSLPACS